MKNYNLRLIKIKEFLEHNSDKNQAYDLSELTNT